METICITAVGQAESNPGPASVSISITRPAGEVLAQTTRSIGNATEDYAAYEAVAASLRAAIELFGKDCKKKRFALKVSNQFVKQLLQDKVKLEHPGLVPLFIEIHNMRVEYFPQLTIAQMRR